GIAALEVVSADDADLVGQALGREVLGRGGARDEDQRGGGDAANEAMVHGVSFGLPHEAVPYSLRAAPCEAAPYIFVMFDRWAGSAALSGALGAFRAELRAGLPFRPVAAVGQILTDLEHDLQVLEHAGIVPVGFPLVRRLVI